MEKIDVEREGKIKEKKIDMEIVLKEIEMNLKNIGLLGRILKGIIK
jgi:hypothetical protein